MGVELIFAMVAAAAFTHAYEQGKTRSAARWQESRERARQKADEREASRAARSGAVRDRFHQARSKGPRDPLWWAYATGYAAAGTAAAVGASVVGAVSGARKGARSGYHVGREGTRNGWGLREAWSRWRQQNPRDPITLQQCERCGGWAPELHSTMDHGDVCDDCLPADTRDNHEPDPHTTAGECRSCGRTCPPYERDADGWCRSCVDAARDVQDGHGASPCARCRAPVGHRSTGAGSSPGRIVCHSCTAAEQAERQPNCFLCARPTPAALLNTDGLCPTCGNWERSGVGGECNNQCSNSNIDPDEAERQGRCPTCGGRRELITDFGGRHRHVPCRDCYGTGNADADNAHEPPGEPTSPQGDNETPDRIHVHAERVHPHRDQEETPQPKEITNTMSALMPANSSDVDSTGEGFTDTVTSLQGLANLMNNVLEKVTDLNDNLTSNDLDTDTLSRLSDLTDGIEATAEQAKELHRHVEERHNPMAEATASAGGSQNVATKSWYDNY